MLKTVIGSLILAGSIAGAGWLASEAFELSASDRQVEDTMTVLARPNHWDPASDTQAPMDTLPGTGRPRVVEHESWAYFR